MRRLVAKINDSNRAAREKAGQLQEAQDRRRGVLLWVGAGVVTKSIESVSAAAEALCQMMLLPGEARLPRPPDTAVVHT